MGNSGHTYNLRCGDKIDNNLNFVMTETPVVSKNHDLTQEALLIDIGLIRRAEKVASLPLSGFLGAR